MQIAWLIPLAAVSSFMLSLALTRVVIAVAPRWGFVDKPGYRKIHSNPKPLGGGVAITVALVLPLLTSAAVIRVLEARQAAADIVANSEPGAEKTPPADALSVAGVTVPRAYAHGAIEQFPLLLAFVGAVVALHVTGLVDDRHALGPYSKLLIQLVAAAVVVVPFHSIRVMTFLDAHVGGPWLSILLTVLWITAITNAFNFLDNMDGLSAGVAAVCTTAFLIAAISIGQWFVAGTLALLLGAVLGFLFWNFPPSRLFMGDSGSMVIGFVLGVLTVRTTFLSPGEDFGAGWYAVFAPVLVLAVPLYDLLVVSAIRIARGKSPFVGDTNHFSHRLVARGMSRRTAVLCIYLVTAATAVAAILLPQLKSPAAALLVFGQTLLILGVVALLEQHPLPMTPDASTPASSTDDVPRI